MVQTDYAFTCSPEFEICQRCRDYAIGHNFEYTITVRVMQLVLAYNASPQDLCVLFRLCNMTSLGEGVGLHV